MSLFSNTPMLTATSLLSVLLLSSCSSVNDRSSIYNTPMCPSAPTTINNNLADKYGHKDVWRMVMAADKYGKQGELQSALSIISDALKLPNLNANGRRVLYRSKGQAYFSSGKNEEGIKAYETAIAQGGLNTGETDYMVEQIANIKTYGSLKAGDIDAQPIVRIPPIFPPNINESGHCRVKFDVTEKGVPVNIRTTYCTNPVLEKTTVNSIKRWKYMPKIVDGVAVARKSVTSKVTFKLTDECGVLIPEPKQAS